GCEAITRVDAHLDARGREHLKRGVMRWSGEGVGVLAHEERPGDALRAAVLDDRCRDRNDVRLVERRVKGGAAVAGGAERDALLSDRRIWHQVEVRTRERVDVDEVRCVGYVASAFMHGASVSLERDMRRFRSVTHTSRNGKERFLEASRGR